MLAYTTVGVNDMDRAIAFYDAAFAALGIVRQTTSPTWTGYRCTDGSGGWFFLTRPFDKAEASGGNGTMLAWLAESRAAVDGFYAAAMGLGGTDAGPPGVRAGMDPVFYAAYVRDPDGAKLCVFVRK
jgi:catechol 2,3-dioxygenase-like lactoylglutathione lyase family enzyme